MCSKMLGLPTVSVLFVYIKNGGLYWNKFWYGDSLCLELFVKYSLWSDKPFNWWPRNYDREFS